MTRLSTLVAPFGLLLLVGCGKPADPLAGTWDVSDPESAAKGAVTVTKFGDGKFTSERRGEVLGIGKLNVTTTGTYELAGTQATVTNAASKIDASAIPDPQVRAATVRVSEGMVKATEGKPRIYTLKVESPDRVLLIGEAGQLTLTRAR